MQINPRLLILSGILPIATVASADDFTNRVYLTADIGPAFQQNVNISNGGQSIDFNTGVRGDLGVGYCLTPWLAGELQTGFIWSSVDTIGGVPMSSYGGSMDLDQIPLLANVVLTAPAWHRLQPYAGGGLGCVFNKLDFNSPLGNIHDTDCTFAYQALAGVRYQISGHVSVGIGYQFLHTQNHYWEQDGIALNTGGTATHSIMCSLTWNF